MHEVLELSYQNLEAPESSLPGSGNGDWNRDYEGSKVGMEGGWGVIQKLDLGGVSSGTAQHWGRVEETAKLERKIAGIPGTWGPIPGASSQG